MSYYSYSIQPGDCGNAVLRLDEDDCNAEPRFYDAEGNFWPTIEEASAASPFETIDAARLFIIAKVKAEAGESHSTSDTDRLTWLEDQLWNGWTLFSEGDRSEGFELWPPGEASTISAPTLREAIDQAAAKADEKEPTDA